MWKLCPAVVLALSTIGIGHSAEIDSLALYSLKYNTDAYSSLVRTSEIRLSEKIGLDVKAGSGDRGSVSLVYTPFARYGSLDDLGIGKEEPLTFRITIRGYALVETDTLSGHSEFFSFDRYSENTTKKQFVALSVSKRF